MFGLSFAMAPLYNILCKKTGWSGKINLAPLHTAQTPDHSRSITVQFTTSNNAEIPWIFIPLKTHLELHPGENSRVLFYFKNNAKKSMTVQAIPGITPWQAAKYFRKIECFCFKKQTLAAGESRTLPVIFRVENTLPKEIHTMTLAYTLYGEGK